MSTPEQVQDDDGSAIAGRIKAAMARRGVTLQDLQQATALPYRTVQNYILGTTKIPAPAVGRIAKALDVSTDWLILGREPNLDKDSLTLIFEYFDDLVRPQIIKSGPEAGAKAFMKLFKRVYLHHHLAPGIKLVFVKPGELPDPEADGGDSGGSEGAPS